MVSTSATRHILAYFADLSIPKLNILKIFVGDILKIHVDIKTNSVIEFLK